MKNLFKTINYIIFMAVSFVCVTACNPEATVCITDDCLGTVTVYTSKGKIKGFKTDGVNRFYHIDYAKPPTGANRWKKPEPVEPWATTKFAEMSVRGCTQWAMPTAIPALAADEDCLYLNIWAPAKPGPHPVMVFFHGGGLLLGSGIEPSNIPVELVANEDVIVVTMNYRMGVFGFLSLPELTAESTYGGSGNYGFLDQQAALQWVKDEISVFGGDSNNITLFGESAGGLSVCMHMASPMSRTLFQRAIVMSGPCTSWGMLTQAEAEQAGIDLAASFGCTNPATRLACMRAIQPEDMKDRMNIQVNGLFEQDDSEWGFYPVPIIDGYFLDKPFDQMLNDAVVDLTNAGRPLHDVIIGVVENEGSLFEVYKDHPATTSYDAYLTQRFPGQQAALAVEYPIGSFTTTGNALAAIRGDELIVCPSVRLSDMLKNKGYPVYQYVFTERSDSLLRTMSLMQAGSNPPDLGTFHSTEMPFLFGQSGPTAALEKPIQYIVADAMENYWATFAKTGNPNATGYTTWPMYDSVLRKYLVIGAGFPEGSDLHGATCDYWNP